VGGGNRYPTEGYYDTRWLMGLWCTQVPKAVWHWGSNRSVQMIPVFRGRAPC
jgi:hypothetical protein